MAKFFLKKGFKVLLYCSKKIKKTNFEKISFFNATDDPYYALDCCQKANFVIDSLNGCIFSNIKNLNNIFYNLRHLICIQHESPYKQNVGGYLERYKNILCFTKFDKEYLLKLDDFKNKNIETNIVPFFAQFDSHAKKHYYKNCIFWKNCKI
ncbi:MAG: hypothetical protein LBH55_02780 [Mycoplasmataceae bacterium]|nr:hypothetical protein [Mycoplasmataceae bacterium]